MNYHEKRMGELKNWISEQGDISLEELMKRAYINFIHFEDYGRILHLYLTR